MLEDVDWNAVPVFGRPPTGVAVIVRPSVYAIIAEGPTLIALVSTPQGVYLPGGGVEPNEKVIDALLREVREECALAIAIGSWYVHALEHVHAARERAHFEKRSLFCSATIVERYSSTSEPDHLLQWAAPAEALSLLGPKSHRWAVRQWAHRVLESAAK